MTVECIRIEIAKELSKVKCEIDHITEAMYNPLVIEYINREFPDNEPITGVAHLNRLARVMLPLLKEQQKQLELLLTPIPTSTTMPKKRYSRSYQEYLSLKSQR